MTEPEWSRAAWAIIRRSLAADDAELPPPHVGETYAGVDLSPVGAEREVADAHAALAELAESSPSTLALIAEAAASSEIEGIHATATAAAVAALRPDRGAREDLVARNIALLRANVATVDAALAAQPALLPDKPGVRTSQVYIGRTYTAPVAETVPALLDDLRAVEQRELDPVVRALAVHAIFETIHPFGDGNGRVGRALLEGMLRPLAGGATVVLSHRLLADRPAYYRALTAWRGGDHAEWYRLGASAIRDGAEVAIGLAAAEERWFGEPQEPRPEAEQAVMGALRTAAALTVSSASAATGLSVSRVRRALEGLEQRGMVRRRAAGRSTAYVAPELLRLATATPYSTTHSLVDLRSE